MKELIKPKEDDVYPLSIHFTDEQKKRMKIIRIIVFILCFYFVVPFDLYIPAHYRIYYFGTDVYRSRFSINQSDPDANFTLTLMNCRVQLRHDGDGGDSFLLEYGFEFGTPFN
jgi:hypothetical protein